ncbi:MAG: hypothetical protein Q7K03_11385 [Dehalococcoidia bacterium]|nr:hypothetical protein [Dehalococcoidia bacterium]
MLRLAPQREWVWGWLQALGVLAWGLPPAPRLELPWELAWQWARE